MPVGMRCKPVLHTQRLTGKQDACRRGNEVEAMRTWTVRSLDYPGAVPSQHSTHTRSQQCYLSPLFNTDTKTMRSLFTLQSIVLLCFTTTPINASLRSFWHHLAQALIDKYKALSTEEFQCPTMANGMICTTDYAPVICDNVCNYSNQCVAQASGYGVNTHCRLVADIIASGNNNLRTRV